ncbi:HTH domain-containing protein [Haloglomus litoreum]|uniref:HTH domain-containing protein n=1 Tax=Haloglomus litoreum TaxID=3034026 RepID=UPI0023E817D4|nr:HTH domain-containing protein [Haloglomus sp. DT116]
MMPETEPRDNHSSVNDDERLLNVLRESKEETLTTQEITEKLSVGERAVQKRLKRLKNENRVEIDTDGKPIHWRLGEDEPRKPVYHPRISKAKRRANIVASIGQAALILAIAMLGAAGFVISLNIFSRGNDIPLPVFQDVGIAVIGTYVGVGGAVFFGLAGLAIAFGVIYPRVIAWNVYRTTVNQE